MAQHICLGHHRPMEVEMDKRGKAPKKAKARRSGSVSNQALLPDQPSNEGSKRASATHDRKPVNRGSGRGR